MDDCLLCDWAQADTYFNRVLVWEDDLWRMTTSLVSPVRGFSYLEPKRHIAYITDLDGAEAATLGNVLAFVTSRLRIVTQANLVYVNVFGERVAHLHFNLAPHVDGDALRGGYGMIADHSRTYAIAELETIAAQLRQQLKSTQIDGRL